MSQSRLVLTMNLDEFAAEVEDATKAGLRDAAAVGAAVAEGRAPRGETGKLASGIGVGNVYRTSKGWAVDIYYSVYYGLFQELGWLGGRKAKLKQPGRRRAASGEGSGGKPRRFMAKGRLEARKVLLAFIARRIPGAP